MLEARKLSPLPVPEPPRSADRGPRAKAGPRRSGLKSIPFLLLLGCFLFGLVITAQYSSMVSLNYRLSRAETRLEELDEEYRQLEQQAAQLSSLSRIESIARAELGMCDPESGQLIVMTAGREEGSPVGE
ncbi:MAG: cell division protein FtsL [Firmicutes bacterium]|nr:cell division protein FtsL [Bacillota bacterium]